MGLQCAPILPSRVQSERSNVDQTSESPELDRDATCKVQLLSIPALLEFANELAIRVLSGTTSEHTEVGNSLEKEAGTLNHESWVKKKGDGNFNYVESELVCRKAHKTFQW